jgi:hypothetical protein
MLERTGEGGVMGRLSSTKESIPSEKKRAVASDRAAEDKEHGYAEKPVRTATEKADERTVWDEV